MKTTKEVFYFKEVLIKFYYLALHSSIFFIYLCGMNIENAKQQMRKGILEYCVLSIIAEEEAYPSDIIEKLKQVKLIIVEGTLYPLLTRLKNEGILSYRWEESPSGPPRKYYKLTAVGKSALKELHKAWEELEQTVAIIRKKSKI